MPWVPHIAPFVIHGVSNPLAVRLLYSISDADSGPAGSIENASIHHPARTRPAHDPALNSKSPRLRTCATIRIGTLGSSAGLAPFAGIAGADPVGFLAGEAAIFEDPRGSARFSRPADPIRSKPVERGSPSPCATDVSTRVALGALTRTTTQSPLSLNQNPLVFGSDNN